jgi:membrane protein YqaA with SNARE-associated domain
MKEPTEFQYFKDWLLFFLVATVGGGLVGLIIGSFIAAFLEEFVALKEHFYKHRHDFVPRPTI